MDPRTFFKTHVLENYQRWLSDHASEVKAMNAVSEANNMAAYLFHYLQEHRPDLLHGAKKEGDYRAHLVARECPDFQIIWDLADGHKHVKLAKQHREVS